MRKELFEGLVQSLIECFNLNSPRKAVGEVEGCMECDCMSTCPNKPPRDTEPQSEHE